MTGNRPPDLVSEYLAYGHAAVSGALDNSRQWAFEEVNRLVEQEPELAWPMMLELVRRSADDRILAFVAAGPLEDLIRYHGSTFIDRIESAGKDDEQFRKAVSGVWPPDDVPTDIQARLLRLIGDGPRL